ncbi:SusC/RagA family TonB-linked outer membrane protein [Prolixibacteraceae bacterium JC049]|nr:SusC/RagA family TonB-linked outer membrane protein [Prolixibacteraceae bacterium JC049]
MTKRLLLVLVLVNAFMVSAWAQRTLTGKVTAKEDGEPLPGVNVVVKGTTIGITTDFDGKYSINAPANAETLVFSFIGMETKEVKIGSESVINVMLGSNQLEVDEVVVTALGIKKEEKTLTYAQQQIGGDEISKTRELNFASSLAGKTSGVQLKKSTSGAGGSTKIVLRGNKSVFGVSSPLFVIDGVPMVNNNSSTPNDFWGGRDGGDGLSQINPDDIESMSVLKGANAAALYGSQGANGVIIITTKKGKKGKVSGSFSTSTSFEKAIELPDLQYKYGSKGGDENWSTDAGNYNDKFVDDFFDTGLNTVNSISLSGGSDKTTTYFSYANTYSQGIMPGNKYMKHNLTFKQSTKYFDDRLTVSSRIMLTDEKTRNKAQSGYYFNPLTGLYLFPREKDFNTYKQYEKYNADRNMMLQNWHVDSDRQQNPYWIVNNNQNTDRTKRMIANLVLDYKFSDNLKLQVRGNYDYSNVVFEKKIKAGTVGVLSHENGRWQFSDYKNTQMYADAIFTYNKKFGDFDLNAVFGGSYEKQTLGKGVSVDSDTHGLQFANEFNFQNISKQVLVNSTLSSQLEKQSLFANAQIGYKNMLFLDISGRNDWSSTLAFTDNYSYFYPSFGMTALLNEMFEMPESVSLAKVRASYSIVSNEVPAFFTLPLHSIGINGVEMNTEKPFKELKPEDQKNLEIGTDWRFFGGRLGIDMTYYRINNKNQFIPLPAPSGSGYTKYYVNAGHIRNTGFEATIHATPIKKTNFSWNTSVNFSTNKNEIVSLHEELKGKYQLSAMDGYALYITEGGSFGDIYVSKFVRDEQGRMKIGSNGAPIKTSEPEKIGNAEPKFLMGWNNNFSYKNFDFSFLIDGKFGGKAVSMTQAVLDGYGSSKATADARDAGGVKVNGVDDKGNAVTKIDAETYYKAVGGRDGIMENYVYDATNIRLRQLAITYNWNLSQHSSFFKKASFSLIANNLFFIYKDAPFDPDMSMSTGNGLQSVEHFTTPVTRTYGFSVKVNF